MIQNEVNWLFQMTLVSIQLDQNFLYHSVQCRCYTFNGTHPFPCYKGSKTPFTSSHNLHWFGLRANHPIKKEHSSKQDSGDQVKHTSFTKRHTLRQSSFSYSNHGTQTRPTHLTSYRGTLSDYNIICLQDYNLDWTSQTMISGSESCAFPACLFHFNLDKSLLVCYLDNNCAGACRTPLMVI